MKTKPILQFIKYVPVLLLELSTLNFQVSTCFAQGNAFTYQGRLNDAGAPANGTYDFRFKLFLDSFGNTQAGSAVLTNGIAIANGLFTVNMDFGAGTFNGSNYWLEVDVRTNGSGGYANLSPLQALTPSPYAIFANTASNLSGTISSANLSGAYGGVVTFSNSGNNFNGSFNGNGSSLTNVNAAALAGLAANQFWKTPGNSNTVAGADFLGTTDNQPLDFRVNNSRALQLMPTTNTVNVIGGDSHNFVAPGVYGATIGGGGTLAYSGGTGMTNKVLAPFATIGGGVGNTASGNATSTNGDSATVGGGWRNSALGNNSTVAGGVLNQTLGDNSAIGGGYQNTIQSKATYATISGGTFNTVQSNTYYSTIAGGYHGGIGSPYASIGGGALNTIGTNSNSGTISGGYAQTIANGTFDGTIGGGSYEVIGTNCYGATIGGGGGNTVSDNSTWSTIAGGYRNTIGTNAVFATIGGGLSNLLLGSYATIPGGYSNVALGAYSLAAGRQAHANQPGSFVWADSQGADFASSSTNQFLVRASGGVGIGTTSPGQALTVQGATGNHVISWQNDSYTLGILGISGNDNSGLIALGSSGVNNVILRANGPTYFTGGNVGIGTITPQTALHVKAGNSSQLRLEDTTYGKYWNLYTEVNGSPSSSGNLLFQASNGTFIYFDTSGFVHSASDERLKRDIAPLDGVLERLLQLRPVSYHMRSLPDAPTTLGFIAQEVEPLFPEVVGETSGLKSLAYSKFVPVTVRAIQELNQKNEKLQADLTVQKEDSITKDRAIEQLERSNHDLQQRVERLERRFSEGSGQSRL